MARQTMGWLLGAAVGFLALIGVGASATHYLQEPYNPGFIRFATIVALHVVLGSVYLALAPFQFVKRARSRYLGYHRWAGRLLVAVDDRVGPLGAATHASPYVRMVAMPEIYYRRS